MPPRPRFDRRAPVRELPNINERIKYPQLRVVDSDGKQLGVIDRLKALEIASQRELDLVLVSEKANPPVPENMIGMVLFFVPFIFCKSIA